MRHACISCGKPGGDPRQGGLCPDCRVFGRLRSLGRPSVFLASLWMAEPRS
jgi:hypothetical protein